ncbi:hypothetical protein OHS33_16455 [Streptomyces sp. NBC_00536]|uniref:hypothetical protein n=1 Tax=Streptomyces sp. NBC_00536 TaxID=2975769 RepID=UPI002E81A266|nr:hypothetical protein [Streptomyces sp. NBC_00536]WUC79782.1 hypothetical protein OHS33_16455 [Streptomyces sp. NBC_00536]
MPRGRHRNPEPLHRLLTPTTLAGASITSAGVAWLLAEPVALRLLVAFAGAAGVTAAVVMRAWDRAAGRRVAELTRDRVKDEWRTDERIAELESDLEESRALRTRLDTKLRAKRVELAGLRGEHAALLRRYATAETERASALEGRRLLAIEAAAAPASAPRELPAVSEERTASGAPTPVGYARANAALAALARKAEAGGAGAEAEAEGDAEAESRAEPGAEPGAVPGADGVPAVTAAPAAQASPAPQAPRAPQAPQVPQQAVTHSRPGPAAAVPARRLAAAVAPYAAPRRTVSRVEGGFDFFGTKTAAQARAVIEAVQNEDLADVVGAEVLAAHKAESASDTGQPEFKPSTPELRAVGQVIDLTAHDETEPIDVVQLRTAIS